MANQRTVAEQLSFVCLAWFADSMRMALLLVTLVLLCRYPFDIPSEAFSFLRFKQAFAAVQASIVHLQGVPLARRFALVPLGPPLLSYSSTCKVTHQSMQPAPGTCSALDPHSKCTSK